MSLIASLIICISQFNSSYATASTMSADVISISTIGGQSSSGVTFSSYVYLTAGSSLTLQGANGFITTVSSANASAFFGDGSHMAGIPTLVNGQTFSGAMLRPTYLTPVLG